MFAKNLKFLREKHNMEQLDLAKKLGRKSSSSVSEWEKGKYTPKLKVLNEISKLFNVDIDKLMNIDLSSGDENKNIVTIYNQLNIERQTKVYNYAQHELEEQNKIIDINEIREKQGIYLQSKVSAGTGILDLDPTYGETITYNGEIPNHYDLAFLVSGNSMTPTFEDGEVIFVEKYPNPINGAIMVVQIDDKAYIKKVYLEKDNLRLVSLNQDYDDILADGTNNIRIVGKVVF
ncbi:XRE family transcriptional regulator [Tetragenococcus halophilus]|uniref:Xre family DNA-binding protein n=1 Tax=Tetragenococcus halophilus (strain DSM 20338 / JCM 20259 / NCIMB 9735 / NBRC 12172) TaxID=945021 RepID=A0AAN1SHL3_TETHN|nr:XRE family transcriptional regulator [Tetragenococcus halophilus]BAK95175.1 putative Xre family DNA-binding protein [Tetragenococcus halophilus NBRC 12172]GBD71081.1 putative Xre family DNA-binding protein [Tetragenococcus halophilus subsp. halophilus]